jgi:hypothetical protein
MRLRATRNFLLATICGIEKIVKSCVSNVIFNLDQVKISEWDDYRSEKVIVPIALRWIVRQLIMEFTGIRRTRWSSVDGSEQPTRDPKYYSITGIGKFVRSAEEEQH